MDLGALFYLLSLFGLQWRQDMLNMLAASQAAKPWSPAPPQIRAFIGGIRRNGGSSAYFFGMSEFQRISEI